MIREFSQHQSEHYHEAMRQLKDLYEENLKFLAEKSRFALDEQLAAHLPVVCWNACAHPLFAELDSAERHHEVRYDLPNGCGIMDLLYRTEAGWFIIDFKTDEVHSDAEAQSTIRQNGYDRQVERYAQAISNQLKVEAKTRLVFLNVNNRLTIFDL